MVLKNIFAAGCALFAMLFGAGNIILPLILGRSLGSATGVAMLGFIISGVVIPLVGFIAVMHARGDYRNFLGPLGRIPALCIASLCMALLGPFGAAPRCIAIAYADLSWYLPGLNVALFSILISLVIWICAYKHSNVMTILGCYLGPIKIICLLLILLIGLLSPSIEEPIKVTQNAQIFWQGFLSGFGTMDLLAIIFFSQLVYQSLAVKNMTTNYLSVAAVAGILLTIIYIGFAAVAALHSQKIGSIADDTMLSALASMLLGGRAGIFVNISIGLTCLTTAIALTSTFADFLSRDILRNKISYNMALSISIIISAIMANLGFTGIMKFVLPWLSICYPALMFFAVLYIASCTGLIKTSYARIGFFLVLIVSCIFNY